MVSARYHSCLSKELLCTAMGSSIRRQLLMMRMQEGLVRLLSIEVAPTICICHSQWCTGHLHLWLLVVMKLVVMGHHQRLLQLRRGNTHRIIDLLSGHRVTCGHHTSCFV